MAGIYDDDIFFENYAHMTRSRDGLAGAGEWRQFKTLFPDLTGASVLDLGCGYGWHCKYAVECGAASVVGVDASEKMIHAAKIKNADAKITYQTAAIETYAFPTTTYDCIMSNLVLHYVEDLDAIYKKIYAALAPGGIFLMNIEHPVFTAGVHQEWVRDADGRALYWPVDRYFEPGKRMTHFLEKDVEKQHHTLTQIINGLITCGFCLQAVQEAVPAPEMRHLPEMADEMRRPMMLLVRAEKPRNAPRTGG